MEKSRSSPVLDSSKIKKENWLQLAVCHNIFVQINLLGMGLKIQCDIQKVMFPFSVRRSSTTENCSNINLFKQGLC